MVYSRAWRSGLIDRFYGQEMTAFQMEHIRRYYNVEASPPQWAHCLCLFDQGTENVCGFAYQWDFGLLTDQAILRDRACWHQYPFAEFPHLWDRLWARRYAMSRCPYTPHLLGMFPPVAVVSVGLDAADLQELDSMPSIGGLSAQLRLLEAGHH